MTAKQSYDNRPMWYAMRATYGRNLKAKAMLEDHALEAFVPQFPAASGGARGASTERLAVKDLTFVYASFSQIMAIKRQIPYLHFMMEPCEQGTRPMIIPQGQMDAFRLAIEHYYDGLRYASIEDINLKQGTRVRIHGGILDQQEAYFVKVRGTRAKRICLQVGGLFAITLEAHQLKFIEALS